MAFNSAGPGFPGRYHRSVPFVQQMDFPGMAGFGSSLVDISGAPQQCNAPGLHSQIRSTFVSSGLGADSGRTHPLDLNLGSRAVQQEFPVSSISSFPNSGHHVQRSTESFMQQFQPSYSNHTVFPESSYHAYPAPKNAPALCGSSLSQSQCTKPVSTCLTVDTEKSAKAQQNKKPNRSKKDKKPKGKRVRFIKPGCSDLCRRRCKEKVSQSLREDIFNRYWNLDSDAEKKEFIANNAIKMPMMKCREGSRRSFSVDWAFSINGESYSVCKLFFLHTLDIPENTAYASIKESAFFTDDTSIIDNKEVKKPSKSKPTWFETDLDDYSASERRGWTKKVREESFSTREKYMDMRPGCSSCRRNCQSKFTREDRLAIFNEYRCLSNIRKQRDYIAKYIIRTERKRIRPGLTTRRGCSIEWSLLLKGANIPVCKTFFLHTVGISERAAYNIGLQNEIKPVARTVKNPRKPYTSSVTSGKGKAACLITAKGKLKSALIRSRKKVEKVDSDTSDTEMDMYDEDYYSDSWEEIEKKSRRKGGKRKRRSARKSVRSTRSKAKTAIAKSEDSEGSSHSVPNKRNLRFKMRLAPSLFKLPIKKRDKHMQRVVPVLKIKKDRLIAVESMAQKKKRNPYKRKETPKQVSFPPCQGECPKKCRKNLSEDICKEIFDSFWSLKNMEEQRDFISSCVKKEARATCSCLVASKLREKRRGYKIHWNLCFRGLEISVCKTFFLHVLQISDSVVYRAIRNDEQFEPSGPPLPCKHFTGQQQNVTSNSHKEVTSAAEHLPENSSNVGQDIETESRKEPDMNDRTIPTSLGSFDSTPMENHASNVQTADRETCSGYLDDPAVTFESCAQQVAESLSRENAEENSEESTAGTTFCQIEANYESLIPSLNEEETSSVDQVIPSFAPHLHSQSAFPQFCPSVKDSDVLQGSQRALPVNNLTDIGLKPGNSCHSMPGRHNIPAFPTLTDFRMDNTLGNCFPGTSRDFPHLFPMDSRSRMGPQSHFSNHAPPFSFQPSTDISSNSTNQALPTHFGSEMMGFFNSQRFSALNVPVPRDCGSLKPQNSHFSFMEGTSHENSVHTNKSLVLQSLNNANNGILSSSLTKTTKPKKQKKKPAPVQKPKVPKVSSTNNRKRREKKPFTKRVKPGCADSCKRKCGVKIPHDVRENLFNDFWDLENDTKRREYVLPIVKKMPKKSCSGVNSRRCCTIEWALPNGEERHIVCKRFFLDTFDIGEKFVKTVFDKVEKMGGSMQDMRGRHCKRSNIFMKEQDTIDNHIRSMATLKAIQCAQCKKDFTRWCTEPGLSMSHFYKTYADKRKLEGVKPACRASFIDICGKKFSISMAPLKEDMCDQCTSLMPPAPEQTSLPS